MENVQTVVKQRPETSLEATTQSVREPTVPVQARSRTKVGRDGERAAAVFLVSEGYKIVDLNWRNGVFGEIDIVASKGGLIVFVEVKTRRYLTADDALAAVDENKLLQLKHLGAVWISQNAVHVPCRFDVIGVQLRQGREPIFEWLKDVAQ